MSSFRWLSVYPPHKISSFSVEIYSNRGFPGDSDCEESTAMQETQVRCLDQKDSGGGGNGNELQYSCPENLWTEEPSGLQSMGLQKVRHY